jgi:hypothetical protein
MARPSTHLAALLPTTVTFAFIAFLSSCQLPLSTVNFFAYCLLVSSYFFCIPLSFEKHLSYFNKVNNPNMEPFDNDFASITYDAAMDAIILSFKKQAPPPEFIKINQKVLDRFRTLKTNRFYVDTRKIGVVSLEGQQWVINNLFPGMIDHLGGRKLYHVQLVNPAEVFGKVAASNIKSKAVTRSPDEKLVIESFDSEQEAKEWLGRQVDN